MTKMVIDNRAAAKKAYEVYEIDRNEYPTVEDIMDSAVDMMNNETYRLTVYEDDKVLFSWLNTVA